MKNVSGIKFVYALLIAVFAFGAFAAPSAKAAPNNDTIVDVVLATNAETGEFSIENSPVSALVARTTSTIVSLLGAAFAEGAAKAPKAKTAINRAYTNLIPLTFFIFSSDS